MSVVKRERARAEREERRKRKREALDLGGGPAPPATAPKASSLSEAAKLPPKQPHVEPGATVTFLFEHESIELPLQRLLEGAAPGWLLASAEDLSGAAVSCEETPVPPEQRQAFRVLLRVLAERQQLGVVFSRRPKHLVHAFLVCHLLGLEHCAAELRETFLRAPAQVLATCRGSSAALLRALDLGLAQVGSARVPESPCLKLHQAAEFLLRAEGSSLLLARQLGRVLDASGENLSTLWRAARLLRLEEPQLLLKAAAERLQVDLGEEPLLRSCSAR
ncbi:unnamed protein product, partial [Effrenium voratum]